MHKRWIWLGVLIFTAIALAALDNRLAVNSYAVDSPKIDAPVRIALVTDLHSCRYGEGQAELIGVVHREEPDLVLLGGDIFDDKIGDANAEAFIAGIAGEYPCYYVTGNHEHYTSPEAFAEKMAILEKYGVKRLCGNGEAIQINGQCIYICGVDDPDAVETNKRQRLLQQLDAARSGAEDHDFTLLLSHRPEYFETYCDYGFDLVLSGHAHGGQWRLPGIINGLFAPNQGFFPEYAGGKYINGETTMIVSRGLARESTRIPRIFNRPELVMVELG